jgi:hypothetical protein
MRATQRETSGLLETSTEVDLKQQDNGTKQRELQAHEILPRLGVDAVLLPVGSKKNPIGNGWQKRRYDQTQTPKYQEKLKKNPAIGVLLGAASQGLCSIDCDCDYFKSELLKLNPSLRDTLQTKAKKGGNLWVVVEGYIPRTHMLKSNGTPLGEWRSERCHTVIAGAHPEGLKYRVIVDNPPVRLRFSDLKWPENDTDWPQSLKVTHASPLPPSSSSQYSLSSLSQIRPLSLAEKLAAEEEALSKMPKSTRKLYDTFIKRRFTPKQGCRNAHIVGMGAFLFQTVGKKQLVALLEAYYDLNQSLFEDSKAIHMAEVAAIIEGRRSTWLESLNPDERALYESLPVLYREAFRICRDLALYPKKEAGGYDFFLSCNDLGCRLDCHPQEAHRILESLKALRLLSVAIQGTQHSKEAAGIATRWIWLTPQPKPAQKSF